MNSKLLHVTLCWEIKGSPFFLIFFACLLNYLVHVITKSCYKDSLRDCGKNSHCDFLTTRYTACCDNVYSANQNSKYTQDCWNVFVRNRFRFLDSHSDEVKHNCHNQEFWFYIIQNLFQTSHLTFVLSIKKERISVHSFNNFPAYTRLYLLTTRFILPSAFSINSGPYVLRYPISTIALWLASSILYALVNGFVPDAKLST